MDGFHNKIKFKPVVQRHPNSGKVFTLHLKKDPDGVNGKRFHVQDWAKNVLTRPWDFEAVETPGIARDYSARVYGLNLTLDDVVAGVLLGKSPIHDRLMLVHSTELIGDAADTMDEKTRRGRKNLGVNCHVY